MTIEEMIRHLEHALSCCGDHDNMPTDENAGDQRDTGEIWIKPVLLALKHHGAAPAPAPESKAP